MDAFCHVTPPPLRTQQKPRVTEAQHNAEKYFLFTFALLTMLISGATCITLMQNLVLKFLINYCIAWIEEKNDKKKKIF